MPINDGCTPSSFCMLLSTPGIDCIGRFLDCDEPNPTLHAHIHRKATAKPMNPDQNPPPPSQPPPQKYPTTAANDFTPVRIQKPKEDLKIAVEGDAELERADKNKDGFLDQQEMLDAFDENSDKVLDRDEMAKVQRAKKDGRQVFEGKVGKVSLDHCGRAIKSCRCLRNLYTSCFTVCSCTRYKRSKLGPV